jgi:hypothetical protein
LGQVVESASFLHSAKFESDKCKAHSNLRRQKNRPNNGEIFFADYFLTPALQASPCIFAESPTMRSVNAGAIRFIDSFAAAVLFRGKKEGEPTCRFT